MALGSDTNGSIRVPASLCGLFGLKPTYGRLSRAGSFPFVDAFDHLGPLARSVEDLALSFDAMQGWDPDDPVCTDRDAEPTLTDLGEGIGGLRIAIAGDYFAQGAEPEALEAVAIVAKALGASKTVVIPQAAAARSAAYVITAIEGSQLHLPRLRTRPQDFDPDTRERFMAGALLPGAWYVKAQRFRRHYRAQVQKLFGEVDIILAPATPCTAPKLGQVMMKLGGVELPVRANLGLYTQPISFIGLPVVVAPLQRPGGLPIGVQIIANHYKEGAALRVARHLEKAGRRQRASRVRTIMEINNPDGPGRGHGRLRALREGAQHQRRDDARRALLEQPEHAALRRRRAALRLRPDRRLPRRPRSRLRRPPRSAEGLDRHLRPRLRHRQLRVPPPRLHQDRPAEPHLAAHARRLAHRRRPRLAARRADGDESTSVILSVAKDLMPLASGDEVLRCAQDDAKEI